MFHRQHLSSPKCCTIYFNSSLHRGTLACSKVLEQLSLKIMLIFGHPAWIFFFFSMTVQVIFLFLFLYFFVFPIISMFHNLQPVSPRECRIYSGTSCLWSCISKMPHLQYSFKTMYHLSLWNLIICNLTSHFSNIHVSRSPWLTSASTSESVHLTKYEFPKPYVLVWHVAAPLLQCHQNIASYQGYTPHRSFSFHQYHVRFQHHFNLATYQSLCRRIVLLLVPLSLSFFHKGQHLPCSKIYSVLWCYNPGCLMLSLPFCNLITVGPIIPHWCCII